METGFFFLKKNRETGQREWMELSKGSISLKKTCWRPKVMWDCYQHNNSKYTVSATMQWLRKKNAHALQSSQNSDPNQMKNI